MVGATKWQVKTISTLTTSKGHPLVLLSPPHITQNTVAKSMAKLISPLCGKNSQLSTFQGDLEPFKDHLNSCSHLTSLRNKSQKSSLDNFQHQYLPKVNVCSNCQMFKSVLCFCVHETWLQSHIWYPIFLYFLTISFILKKQNVLVTSI